MSRGGEFFSPPHSQMNNTMLYSNATNNSQSVRGSKTLERGQEE